jgi:GntR family transcriptional regulator
LQRPPPSGAERLCLPSGAEVVAIGRLGIVEDAPLLFILSYLPYEIGVYFLNGKATNERMTIAAELGEKYGIEISSAVQTISATLADRYFAGSLGVEVGSPVLEGQRTYDD